MGKYFYHLSLTGEKKQKRRYQKISLYYDKVMNDHLQEIGFMKAHNKEHIRITWNQSETGRKNTSQMKWSLSWQAGEYIKASRANFKKLTPSSTGENIASDSTLTLLDFCEDARAPCVGFLKNDWRKERGSKLRAVNEIITEQEISAELSSNLSSGMQFALLCPLFAHFCFEVTVILILSPKLNTKDFFFFEGKRIVLRTKISKSKAGGIFL